MARRRPIRRLKSALLPTLGRPTTATVAGRSIRSLPAGSSTYARRASFLSAARAAPGRRRRRRCEKSRRSCPSIYIETFGCQMNEADSQYVADRAVCGRLHHRRQIPKRPTSSCINTCTVRDNAERRAYGRMNHFKALKDAAPATRLVVMGCLAEQDRRPNAHARAARRRRLRNARTRSTRRSARRMAAGFLRSRRFRRRAGLLDTVRRHGRRRRRRVFALARVRQRAARLLVLLHVLHRAARARPFRPPSARRDLARRRSEGRRRRARSDARRADRQRVDRSGDRATTSAIYAARWRERAGWSG